MHIYLIACGEFRKIGELVEAIDAVTRAVAWASDSEPNRKSGKRQQEATLAPRIIRAKRKAERLDKIRDRWHDRAYDTDELIKEAGLSRRTVYNELKARFPDDERHTDDPMVASPLLVESKKV